MPMTDDVLRQGDLGYEKAHELWSEERRNHEYDHDDDEPVFRANADVIVDTNAVTQEKYGIAFFYEEVKGNVRGALWVTNRPLFLQAVIMPYDHDD